MTIRFSTNVPQTVRLRFLEAKPVDSRFGGIQHMFSADEGAFYVSEVVGSILTEQFVKLGVKAGDPVEICKAEVTIGTRKSIQWQVAIPVGARNDGTFAVARPEPQPEPPTQLEQQLAASIKLVEARKDAVRAQAAAPAETPRWAQVLEQQTKHLCDVYANLVNYASDKHGNAVKPEDIRNLMTTAFIALSKGGINSNAA